MAINIRYQYREVPIYTGDNFFTAYMSSWMRARVPLVQARMKREMAGLDMDELLKRRNELDRMKTDVTHDEHVAAQMAGQFARGESSDITKTDVANVGAQSRVAVARENRAADVQVVREEGQIRMGESGAITPADKTALDTALAGIQSETAAAVANARSPEEAGVAYQKGMAMAASAISGLVTGANPMHDNAVKDEAARRMRGAVNFDAQPPDRKAALVQGETAGYWSTPTVSLSAPEQRAPVGTYEQQMGLPAAPQGGGFTPAPVRGVSTTAPTAPAVQAAPAADQGVPAAPGTRIVQDDVTYYAQADGTARPITYEMDEKEKAAVRAGTSGGGTFRAYTNKAGVSQAEPTSILQSGTPVGEQRKAELQAQIDDIDAELARRLQPGSPSGRATLNLREPMTPPSQARIDAYRKLTPEQSLELKMRAQKLLDDAPSARARARAGKKADATKYDVLDRSDPTKIPGGTPASRTGDTLSKMGAGEPSTRTNETPFWYEQAAIDDQVAILTEQRDAGSLTPEQYAAAVQEAQRGPQTQARTRSGENTRTARVLLESQLVDFTTDPKARAQAASIIDAAQGDPAKVRSIREKAPTGTPEERELAKALEGWEKAHASEGERKKAEAEKAVEAESMRPPAKMPGEDVRKKAEAAVEPGAYEALKDEFTASNEIAVEQRKKADAASPESETAEAPPPKTGGPGWRETTLDDDEETQRFFGELGETPKGTIGVKDIKAAKPPKAGAEAPAPVALDQGSKIQDDEVAAYDAHLKKKGVTDEERARALDLYRKKKAKQAEQSMGLPEAVGG